MKNKLLVLLATPFVMGLLITFVQPKNTAALSGSDFSAGNIIDDAVFYDSSALNATDVQSFLNAKLPSCDTNGTKNKSYYYNSSTGRVSGSSFSGATYVTTSRATYGSRYDKYYKVTYAAAPYVCLKDYKQNTPEKLAISDICGYLPARTGRSGAQIITDVSAACGINPKVLIVLLQKEQGLVTDDWPWDNQFDKATGFACPDTSGCNTAYYGFFNQVYSAAKQFKRYQADPTNWNYVAGQNNKIYYNPNSSCGYSWVFIQNQATAGLYDYTPYQPNAAALKNLYGSGDSCSAYGNRNFWRYFNDWFGTTRATPFFRIGSTAPIYVLGANNNYYHVPSWYRLEQYGFGSRFSRIDSFSNSYIQSRSNSGDLPQIARFGDAAIYQLDGGGAHHYPSQTVLNAFGFTVGQEAALPSWIYSKLAHPEDMQQVVRQAQDNELYYFNGGKKSHIINSTAYTTLGTPTYSTQPSVRLNDSLVSTFSAGAPIMPAGTFVKESDTNKYGFWDGTNLQLINTTPGLETGLHVDYIDTSSILRQLPLASATLDSIAKDTSGNKYIISSHHKYLLSSQQIADLNISDGQYPSPSQDFLDKIQTSSVSILLIRSDQKPEVYKLESSGLYRIPSRLDLDKLGYNLGDVLDLGSATVQLIPDSGKVKLGINRPLRLDGTSAVYLTDSSSSKIHVPNRITLHAYGFNILDTLNVTSQSAADYAYSGGTASIYVKDNAGSLWIIDSGGKHSFPQSLLSSSYYNYPVDRFTLASNELLDSLPASADTTSDLRDSSNGKIYRISGGKKHWYTSRAAFLNHGGNWASVVTFSSDFVTLIPNGTNIN